MQVQDVMSREVELTSPDAAICDVARKMRTEDIGALPIGENDRLTGMITDRDIVLRAVANERSPRDTSVREVMSEKICYCFEDDDVEDAAHLMAEHQVRRLPVLDRNKRLVGMVTLADLGRSELDAAKLALTAFPNPQENLGACIDHGAVVECRSSRAGKNFRKDRFRFARDV